MNEIYDVKYSKSISDFLNFVRDVQQEYNLAVAEEQDADNATQDILHNIELCANKYHDYARLSIALREVRQQRRRAKDKGQVLRPIVDFLSDNAKTIKTLERLLGDVRKAEKSIEGRAYIPRTDIVERTLGGRQK